MTFMPSMSQCIAGQGTGRRGGRDLCVAQLDHQGVGDGEGLAVGREESRGGEALAPLRAEGPGDDDVLGARERWGVQAPGEAGKDARGEVGVDVCGEEGGAVEDGPDELREDVAGGVGGPVRRRPWGGDEGAPVDGAGVNLERVVTDGAADEAAAKEAVGEGPVAGPCLVCLLGADRGGDFEVEVGGRAGLEEEGIAVVDADGAVFVAVQGERDVKGKRAPYGDLGGAVDVASGEAGAVATVATVKRAVEAARDGEGLGQWS